MPGDIGHFDDTSDHDALEFASHDSDLGGSGGLGSELFDTAPHDPADSIPALDHSDHPADHDSSHGSEHHSPSPAEPVSQHSSADHTPSDDTTEHPPAHEAPHYDRPGSHVQMDIHGIHYDAGRVDVDMNGDGHADTAVIHSERDGVAQVEYYTDNDGDGHADELTITDAQGQLISHTELDEHTGRWDETHLDHRLPSELPDR
jgi:hypothetical protein